MKSDKQNPILSAAIDLFTKKGFDNTSTANISKKAGVATGTLFVYFKSKEDLIVRAGLVPNSIIPLTFFRMSPLDK